MDLKPNEISILESGLNRLYLVQFRHLQNLEALKKESRFFEELNSPEKKISLRATAYLTPKKNSSLSGEFKSNLKTKLGSDFISNLEYTLKKEILSEQNELARIRFPNLPPLDSREKFPFFNPGPYLKIRDILEGILFCQMIREEWGLDTELTITDADEPLSSRELELLQGFYQKQEEELLQILQDRDPGWAFSALVSLGRIHAIQESIQIGYPVFLSSFPEDSTIITRKTIQEDKEAIAHLSKESVAMAAFARKNISNLDILREKEYQIWEDATNRAYELEQGLQGVFPIRIDSGKLIPQRERQFLISMFLPENNLLQTYAKISKQRELEYHSKLKKLYPFQLFYKNCTTAIIEDIQNSFDSKETKFPGKKIDFGFSLEFIPFYASYSVSNRWKNHGEHVFLSYRKRKLEEMSKSSPGIFSILKESSPLSSSFYKPNREDHFFPLFTDDIFWLRPIYGITNLSAGLGATAIGVFTLPADLGKGFQKGIQSSFFSLPELVFFNIRKGTFPYIPIRELPEQIYQFQDED